MAEAAVESRNLRFYCHQCSAEISPTLPEYTCPQCDSGFIEEMTGEDVFDENDPSQPDPASQFAELWERHFLETFRLRPEEAGGDPDRDRDESEPEPRGVRTSRHQRRVFPSQASRVAIHRRPADRNHAALEGIINHILGTLAGGGMFAAEGMPFFQLHANPGDYAWGADGLDSIVTQLLNQLEGAGAPPAEKDKIDSIPTIKITKELLGQCSVCFDDFELDEEVRQLACRHCYHSDCIVPWLQRHGSCPICRKDLNGKEIASNEDNPQPMEEDTDININSSSNSQDPTENNNSSSRNLNGENE